MSVSLALMVLVTYSSARSFQFISLDDPQYVSANQAVLSGLSIEGIRWAFTNSSFYWHPLTWLSLMADVEMFGPSPAAFHVVNVALHAANTVLLFLVLERMTGARGKSAFVAALFALHPLHVESVAWVAERKDVLSTLFWMMSLWLYSLYAARPGAWLMVGITVAFACGLLAKPMILTLPFVLLLLDAWPLKRMTAENWRRAGLRLVIEKIPLFALTLTSLLVTIFSQRGSRAVIAVEALSISSRISNATVSYTLYLRDMLWPTKLAPFYPLDPPSVGIVVIAVSTLVAITVAVFLFRQSRPYLTIGWLWYLGTLVPVVGFLQAGDQGRADRFTYVPLIGVFIALTWLAADLLQRMRLPRSVELFVGGALTIVLAVATRHQLMFWKDDLSLWERTVSVTQNNYRAENLYGVALTDRGRLDEGIRHYEASISIWNENPEAHNNLGAARMEQSNYTEAVKEFDSAAKARPGNAMYRYNLAVALDATGRRDDAVKEVLAGLRIDPASPSLRKAAEVFGVKVPQ